MRTFFVATLILSAVAVAGEPDVTSLYDVKTDGSSSTLKAGEKGKIVISINAKNGAHVSDEAPLRIELSAKDAKLEKEKLTLADSLEKKSDKVQYPDPRFEVGFQPSGAKSSIEAKMTFFICTEKVCARQTKTLSFPVTVN
jgi:hypothetical protein